MAEGEKGNGFMNIITEGLSYVSKIVSASLFPPIAEGAELIMKNIDERIKQIEKRIERRICSFLLIGYFLYD